MKNIKKWKEFGELDLELKQALDLLTDLELEDAFYKDLDFGTNRMNIYTLRKANYGFGKYLLKKYPHPAVVIAYDSRHKSYEFAIDCARTLGALNIKVYFFGKITPTPQLSFAVRRLQAQGGIVITASHNPPQYNGYKIYDEYGCQMVPDLIEEVKEEIKKAPDAFFIQVGNFSELQKVGMITEVEKEIDDEYLKLVRGVGIKPELEKDDFLVVFTPLHGTAALFGERLLQNIGYHYRLVSEQMIPDPNFSTVDYPNPEDPKAFRLAFEYGEKYHADILLATDPDADRIGLAVLDEGIYHLLSGNQTGAILLYYLINEKKNIGPGVVFNTVVTSDLGAKIARVAGLDVKSTLTGFKYIGEQAKFLEGTDKEFFFGYEESFGFVVKPFVRDKDSLQALVLCCEAANFYKLQGKTLIQVLEEIFQKYGYHQEELVNLQLEGKKGSSKIKKIMNYFRDYPVSQFGNYFISAKEDYLIRTRSTESGISPLLLPASDVIKFYLEDGSWVVLRPSGTEPKLKIYLATVSESSLDAEAKIKELKNIILKMIDKVG